MQERQRSSIEISLQLLETLAGAREGLSAAEIQKELDLSRSSLFAMLNSLKTLGYVEQAEKRGRYRAGSRLKRFINRAEPQDDGLITAFLAECANKQYSETVLLLTPSEDGMVVTASYEARHALRISCSPGQRLPGTGAVENLFAVLPPETVIANGYASEEQDGILSISLPVCRDGSNPDMAVQLMAPAVRWNLKDLLHEYLDSLRLTAAHLSYQLGAPAYHPYSGRQTGKPEHAAVMDAAEIDRFLGGPWTASLACIRPDGRPHVIPVWQEWDGRGFYVLAFSGSQWAEYVLKNPNVSLTVDEPWQPLRRVTARGTAEHLSGLSGEAAEQIINRFQERYLGATRHPFENTISHIFRVTPDFLRGQRGIANH